MKEAEFNVVNQCCKHQQSWESSILRFCLLFPCRQYEQCHWKLLFLIYLFICYLYTVLSCVSEISDQACHFPLSLNQVMSSMSLLRVWIMSETFLTYLKQLLSKTMPSLMPRRMDWKWRSRTPSVCKQMRLYRFPYFIAFYTFCGCPYGILDDVAAWADVKSLLWSHVMVMLWLQSRLTSFRSLPSRKILWDFKLTLQFSLIVSQSLGEAQYQVIFNFPELR